MFHVPAWRIRQIPRIGEPYCSRPCRDVGVSRKLREKPNRKTIQRRKDGYVLEYARDHPRADHVGRVLQHILVAERALDRPLAADEEVHHKNGVRHDNRPENLEVMKKDEHQRLHADPERMRAQALLRPPMKDVVTGRFVKASR